MKAKNRNAVLFAGLLGLCGAVLASPIAEPVVISLSNGGQANVALSNTDPNLFTVPGDRIVAINSLNDSLTQQQNTQNGGVIVATLSSKPFTFIIETERGQNFSIRAVPGKGPGRTLQIVGDLMGTLGPAASWEQGQPYESMLVELNKGVLEGKLPDGYGMIPVTNETLTVPYGLRAVAERVWVGSRLKVICFTVSNPGLSSVWVNEHDFWQQGTRAVLFDSPTRQLVGGGRMKVYLTRSEGGANGQH